MSSYRMLSEDKAQELLEERASQEYGVDVEVPNVQAVKRKYSTDSFSPGRFSGDSIVVHKDVLDRDDFDQVVETWVNELRDQALQKVFTQEVEKLAEKMGKESPENLEAFFGRVNGGLASYHYGHERMIHGNQGRDNVIPGDPIEVVSDRTSRNIRHEAGHAIQSGQEGFEALAEDVSVKTGNIDEFASHPDVAGIETLTRFEEDPEGEGKHRMLDSNLGSKWSLPHALKRRIDGGSGYMLGDHLYRGPYDMAEVIAFSLKNHFERKGVEDPVNQTREKLLEEPPSAEEWEEELENIWNEWGVPNYHELFSKHYRGVQNSREYTELEFNRLESELEDATQPDIELFYDAFAFANAYRESGRDLSRSPYKIEYLADTQKQIASINKAQ